MVGLHPDRDLIGAPPLLGLLQATTGKATATSPLTGTVVVGPPEPVDEDPCAVDDVAASREVPHPVSAARASNGARHSPLFTVRRRLQVRTERAIMGTDDMRRRADFGATSV